MALTPEHVRCTEGMHGFTAGAAGRRAVKWGAVTLVSGIAIFTSACGAAPVSPTVQSHHVTVPDNVSGLASDEVQRRLNGLLETTGPAENGGLAAPDAEPTADPGNVPDIEDILDALSSGSAGGGGEMVISVSPSVSQGVADPILRIKTPPAHGDAVILSSSQVLYVPDPAYSGSNSFEYELLDGTTPVFSAVVELRPPAASSGAEGAP